LVTIIRNFLFLYFFILHTSCNKKSHIETHPIKKYIFDLTDSIEAETFDKILQLPERRGALIDLGKHVPQDSTTWVFWAASFQDSLYNIYSHCMGEFGGSIAFQSRNDTNKIHVISSSCVQQIEKVDSGYLIMESLAHMCGFSKIVIIKEPKNHFTLPKDSVIDEFLLKNDSIWQLQNGYFQNTYEDDTLIDIMGYVFVITFIHNNQRFVICSDDYKTYLSEINNGEMRIVDTLINQPSWSYNSNLVIKENGNYYCRYSGHTKKHYSDTSSTPHYRFAGVIAIKGDSIIIGHQESYFKTHDELYNSKPFY
jgi:hypothetical protein